nr:Clp protease N-terminal domain-containing protein [uncultured Acidovorax sp.]
MFQRIRDHFQSLSTLKQLCTGAENHARTQGHSAPGAEHFLLAALDLPDGSARRAFERLGQDPGAVPAAIEQQYRDALQGLGLGNALPAAAPATAEPPRLYRAQPSGEALMQALARSRKAQSGPLRGAHIVALVADMPQGVAARTLKAMGLDAARLATAARAEALAAGSGALERS